MRSVPRALLLAFAIVAAVGAKAELASDLPRHDQLGGYLALFAATIVEGGGTKGNTQKPPHVVVDVTEEFASQSIPPGRITLGKQEAAFRIDGYSMGYPAKYFDIPANGTRFIAFGDPRYQPLDVHVNRMYADTAANRANIAAGRQVLPPDPVAEKLRLGLFLGSCGVAFFSIFLAWTRVGWGATGFLISLALWLAYEVQVPAGLIRVDLVVLFPLLIAALFSTLIAAGRSGKKAGKETSP